MLIVTSRDDAHADHVIRRLNALGREHLVVRINTEDFAQNCISAFDGSAFSIKLIDSGRSFISSECASVWFRRPKTFHLSGEHDSYTKEYLDKQWTAFLRGLYFSTHDSARWINPLPALHRARNKLQQIELASRIGLPMPRTLITNDSFRAVSFINNIGSCITKSLDEPSVYLDGHIFPMFTRELDIEDVKKYRRNIEVCPILIQEKIEKTSDVRVVVFGERVFAVEMVYSGDNSIEIDVRQTDPSFLRYRSIDIPDSLSQLIQEFVRRQGLVFSALDFVVDESNKFVFLENNANGQWLWLERYVSIPLTDSLLSLLLPIVNGNE
ncbi:MvdC/MvdD family ATP grasp protein [Breoghania sp. L-A4]|uniref:MvdC/MvdD family ATP grasp protein n=1 Tax=Breoghania sp. L-A4 TaxID=2304600 RepID=UPI0013C331D7|nr:hypothetical protein [Breoghania sp. L-A4]